MAGEEENGMKVQVTFKTPDATDDAILAEVERLLAMEAKTPDAEGEGAADDMYHDARKALKRWVKYGEYVTVEFDTEAGTAVVLRTGD
jgi:monoamine oxidase